MIRNILVILLFACLTLVGSGCSQESVGKNIADLKINAEHGDVNAQIELGLAYYEGREVPQDKKLAADWFLKAAEQNNISAQHYMGWMYARADGVKKNIEKAIYWYTKAAEQGHVDSQINLANIYMKGEGIKKDFAKAHKWYQQAANTGNQHAQFELAIMYLMGEGVDKNIPKAKELLLKSATQGNKNAQKALSALEIEEKADEYSQKKMNDVYTIACLLEEYKAKANHYPFYDPTPVEEGYVKTGTLVTIASPEAERELARKPNPFGISAARAYSFHLTKELQKKLKRKIQLPVDPQRSTIYSPNAYYVYFPPATDDEYLIITFLYNPNKYTTEMFNKHANAYAIASSDAVNTKFWTSAGIKPRIFKEILVNKL